MLWTISIFDSSDTQLHVFIQHVYLWLTFDVMEESHLLPFQGLSYDEALIEYFGSNSLLQHITQTNIRFGYEVMSQPYSEHL